MKEKVVENPLSLLMGTVDIWNHWCFSVVEGTSHGQVGVGSNVVGCWAYCLLLTVFSYSVSLTKSLSVMQKLWIWLNMHNL